MAYQRKVQKASKLSVVISFLFHALIIGGLVFFAAREGILGKQLKKIAVTMVPKEKPPEKPKEKPEEKPVEKPPEQKPVDEPPKVAATPPPQVKGPAAPPPPAAIDAPAAAVVPSFDFEGGRATGSGAGGPNGIYKGYVEYTLRANWHRPENVADLNYVAEVEVGIDATGQITSSEWKKGSGDAVWDNSVRKALSATTSIGRKPPKGFPEKVLVRFDVQEETEVFAP